MDPIIPPAKSKGGTFPYACKFTDGYTKMKEVFLLRNKSETAEAAHAYNMHVAAPNGYHIEIFRCDKGGENTGEEMRTYYRDAGIKLEYAASKTGRDSQVPSTRRRFPGQDVG